MDEYDASSFGSVLRFFRNRKQMKQRELAKKLECHENSISLWERGEIVGPESHNVVLKIAEVLALNEEEKRLLIEARYGTASILPLYNFPWQRNPYFTGRDVLLHQLHEQLMAKKQIAIRQAINGLGGIGKTQVALEYAYRFGMHYHDILWVVAESREAFIESYLKLASQLRLKEQEQHRMVEEVKRWLREHKRWLLILDNIEDLGLVQEFVPLPQQGTVLLTTRRGETSPVAEALVLDALLEEEAILFLLRRAGYLPREASLEAASTHDRDAAQAIVKAVEGLPLALDQAGAYISETKRDLSDYLTLFERRRLALLSRRGTLAQQDHPLSVVATFSLAFERVQQENEAAIDLLKLCAYLVPDTIPLEIIIEGSAYLGTTLELVVTDALRLDQALEALQAYSLVRRNGRNHTLSIHRLVQAILKDTMDASIARLWVERAVNAVNATFPDPDVASWATCERCLTHALLCAHWITQERLVTPEAVRLLNQAGSYLYEHARYAEAEPLYQQALVIYNQCMNSDAADKVAILNNLASSYEGRSLYTEAEALFKQALAVCEQQLEPVCPEMADCLYNLAHLYESQGCYDATEPLYQQALAICEQLGLKHSKTAQCLNGLAGLYTKQAKYEMAKPLYQQALVMYEQELGTEHPLTATVYHNLAHLYEKQGHYNEATSFYQRALVINKHHLGLKHHNIAACIVSLANLYWHQGKYAEAEPLYQQALAINEHLLGPKHPSTATTLNNMASLYERRGFYEKAKALYQQALAIRKQFFGLNHPDTACSLHNLAYLYYVEGHYTKAEPLFKQALVIRERVLGPRHPHVASTLNNLASLYLAQEKDEEAANLYQRSLHILEQALEPDHPDIATQLLNLVALYFKQGRSLEAEPLYQRALRNLEQAFGALHPKVSAALNEVASLYANQKEPAELYQYALQICERVWGRDHPQAASPLNNLANLYREQERYREADQLYQQALQILQQTLEPQHPLIASALNNLAVLYVSNLGRHRDAESLYQQALPICEQTLGLEHALTQGIAGNYIFLLHAMGQETEALALEARFFLSQSAG